MQKRVLVTIVGVILVGSFLILGLAAPLQAVTKWRYQSMWVPSITLWRGDKYYGDLMNVLCKGELEIKYFPGGTLVKTSNEIFDAVTRGSLQMATDWPSYWEGKNTAFALITSTPLWLTPGDYMLWFWQGGGLELSQELYAKFGLVWYPHSVTGPESGQCRLESSYPSASSLRPYAISTVAVSLEYLSTRFSGPDQRLTFISSGTYASHHA